jgi:hypothetical protein
MASICCSNDLVDVMDILHPHASDVPSYARGPNRLDYALTSLDLVPYLEGAGLNFYHDYYPSNHRPIFIGLARRLFGPLPPCSSHQARYVHSNSPMVALFITFVHRHLLDTGTFFAWPPYRPPSPRKRPVKLQPLPTPWTSKSPEPFSLPSRNARNLSRPLGPKSCIVPACTSNIGGSNAPPMPMHMMLPLHCPLSSFCSRKHLPSSMMVFGLTNSIFMLLSRS